MEEAAEEMEAAAVAAATARRDGDEARYAHMAHRYTVYELQFEHSVRRQNAPAIE